MKIVVIGGTGLIGSKLVTKLRQLGHDVLAASPDSGVNTITGEGLSEALAGARVVVDVANSPSFEDAAVLKFFETSGRNLLAAEAAAGVGHHVALSVVGSDRAQDSGYLRAKVAQENLIKNSSIPYTILRSTQFFEFMDRIAQSGFDGESIRVSPALVQPIVSDDVVSVLAEIAIGAPANATIEVGGPERLQLDEIVRRVVSAGEDAPPVVADARARYFGAVLDDRTLTPDEDALLGTTRFEEWLNERGTRSSPAQPSAPKGMASAAR
ncbi:MAG: SDR family oxidoreductase [Woeseia sp.]